MASFMARAAAAGSGALMMPEPLITMSGPTGTLSGMASGLTPPVMTDRQSEPGSEPAARVGIALLVPHVVAGELDDAHS